MRILLIACSVAALAALAPDVARAAAIGVTTTVDVVDPTDGVISLREAFVIASSNTEDDVITLAPGVEYDLTSCFVGELRHTQPEALTLNGNGSSIYQTCFDRRVINNMDTASAITLNDVALTGGFNSGVSINGVGLKSGGQTTIDNSQIAFLNAGPDGSAIDAGDGMLGDVELVITNSQVYSNVAGTAVELSNGSVEISGSTIINNTGEGLHFVDGIPVAISDTEISGHGGPGVVVSGQGDYPVTLTNVTIEDNDDMGFLCSGCSPVTISGSTISGNGASPSSFGGGGVNVRYDQDGPEDVRATTITDSTIENNDATHRGAGVRISIVESTDAAAPPPLLTIVDSSIRDNATSGFFDIDGGGISVETGDLTLTGSDVVDNAAGPIFGLTSSKGGGIYMKEEGALPETPELELANSTVIGNDANSQGGGIWIASGGAVSITDSSVSDNGAGSLSGGGLYSAGAAVTVTRSTLAANSAGTGGGIAIAAFSGFPAGSLLVVDSTVSANSASFAASGGGGIFVNVGGAGATATVRNTTVSGNSSANLGGGIMVMQTSRLALDHATVAGNEGATGANVFVAATDLQIGKSVLALAEGAGDNCELGGGTTSSGYSFADDTSCNLGPNDLEAAISAQLGPLTDNGGPTWTRLPAPASPVGGLVPNASCTLGADQRGVVRPQGFGCEAGAVEIAESPGGSVNRLVVLIRGIEVRRSYRRVLDVRVVALERAVAAGSTRKACAELGKLAVVVVAGTGHAIAFRDVVVILAATRETARALGCLPP